MRTLSANATASINASETDEVWLAMVILTHPDFAAPIRLVANTENIVHDSQTFIAFPFNVSLPDEEEGQVAVMNWVAANSSNELLEEFRAVSGPISGSVFWVLASSPDDIEIGPMDLELRSFEYDDLTISGGLTVEPVLDAVFGKDTMNPGNTPGLF